MLAHGIQEELSFVVLHVTQADNEGKGDFLKGQAVDPIVERVERVLKSELMDDLEHLLRSGFMMLLGSPNGIVNKGRRSLFSGDSDWVGFAPLFACHRRGFICNSGFTKSIGTGRRGDTYSRLLAKSN
jgi:hypothetical protein